MVALSKECGLAPIDDLPASIGVHFACHSRAQNMVPKAMEMLRLIPGAKPVLTDRCSGPGGKWGILKQNFDTAVKVGRPDAHAMAKNDPNYMSSKVHLAGQQLKNVLEFA